MATRPIGILPLGTGNAFAHALAVGNPRRALRALRSGEVRAIDLMTTTHSDASTATVSISAGFESRILDAVALRRTWRRWLSVGPGLLSLAGRSWIGTSLSVDGELLVSPEQPIYNVGLYNLPYYGFGWLMWPDADPEDGTAEAIACASPLAAPAPRSGRSR